VIEEKGSDSAARKNIQSRLNQAELMSETIGNSGTKLEPFAIDFYENMTGKKLTKWEKRALVLQNESNDTTHFTQEVLHNLKNSRSAKIHSIMGKFEKDGRG
jgi:membrane carboxypeptidase/penicillin-binding protein